MIDTDRCQREVVSIFEQSRKRLFYRDKTIEIFLLTFASFASAKIVAKGGAE